MIRDKMKSLKIVGIPRMNIMSYELVDQLSVEICILGSLPCAESCKESTQK